MSGDPYIKENERLEAEIARLQESVNYLQIADNHHQELMAEKEEEIARLRSELKNAQADKLIDNMKAVETEEKLRADLDTVELGFAAVRHDNARLRAALEDAVNVMSKWLAHQYGPQEQYRAMTAVRDNARKALAKEGK